MPTGEVKGWPIFLREGGEHVPGAREVQRERHRPVEAQGERALHAFPCRHRRPLTPGAEAAADLHGIVPPRSIVLDYDGHLLAELEIESRGAFRGYIQTVLVLPGLRNRGIGRGLIRFAERRVLSASPNVFLCVSSFNRGAQRLYASTPE